MKTVYYNPCFIASASSDATLCGNRQDSLQISQDISMVVENGVISGFLPTSSVDSRLRAESVEIRDCSGVSIIPGFSDSHTHMLYCGDRTREFFQRAGGKKYLEILNEGNGILKTVRDTRGKSPDDILSASMERIRRDIRSGVTSIEFKSGYGLDLETEVSIIGAMKLLKEMNIVDVASTFLGMHSVPPEMGADQYVDFIMEDVFPLINKDVDFVDSFCDEGAFSPEQTDRFFSAASSSGVGLRLHSDEISSIGCLSLAKKHSIVSADHLLKIGKTGIEELKDKGTIATLLPITAFSLGEKYADARKRKVCHQGFFLLYPLQFSICHFPH